MSFIHHHKNLVGVPVNSKDFGIDTPVPGLLLLVLFWFFFFSIYWIWGCNSTRSELGPLHSPASPFLWFWSVRYQQYVLNSLMSISWGRGWYCSFGNRSCQWNSRCIWSDIRPFSNIIDSLIFCLHIHQNKVTPVWMNTISFTVIYHRSFLTASLCVIYNRLCGCTSTVIWNWVSFS